MHQPCVDTHIPPGPLHFADYVVLLASLDCILQVALGWFSASCKAAGITASSSKSVLMLEIPYLVWEYVAAEQFLSSVISKSFL